MSLSVHHKHPWKIEQYLTIAVMLVLIPAILVFALPGLLSYIFAGISFGIGVWLFILNQKRLNDGELFAEVDEDDVLRVWGAGLKKNINYGKTKEIAYITQDINAYHPTLILRFTNDRQMYLPKRIAMEVDLNDYLRHNMPTTLQVRAEGRETFEQIFVAEENRRYVPPEVVAKTEAERPNPYAPATIDEINNGPKPVLNTRTDKERRKAEAKKSKQEKAARIAASVAALEKEEKKLNAGQGYVGDLGAPDEFEPKVVIEPADEAKPGEFPVNEKEERNTYS